MLSSTGYSASLSRDPRLHLCPLAFISGIPWKEAVDAGSIMATKLVTNEFVAMTELANGNFHFTERTTAIISVFLVSFANFSSIGSFLVR